MNIESVWYFALMIASMLVIGGGIAVPLLKAVTRALRLKLLEGVEFVPARGMFLAGAAGVIGLLVVSYLKTGSIVGMMPPPASPAPVQRSLSDPRADKLKAQLLSDLPRDKPIAVVAYLGQEEGCRFANEIRAFLKQTGFKIKETAADCEGIDVPIVYGIKITAEGDELKLFVGFPPK